MWPGRLSGRRPWTRAAFNDLLVPRCYPGGMLRLLLPLLAAPALIAAHSGAIERRTMPELSDIALFVVAVLGVWLARRAMRARARRASTKD